MNCSPALKWLIAVLLPLSLGWKITVHPEDPSELNHSLIEFFARHQFNTVVMDDNLDPAPVIRATTDGCRIFVVEVAPDGGDGQFARRFATSTDDIFVVFRGRVYPNPPTLVAVVSERWSRLLRKMGMEHYQTSVIAVVASTTCNAERLPWNELSDALVSYPTRLVLA
jgi:hypothetical protein